MIGSPLRGKIGFYNRVPTFSGIYRGFRLGAFNLPFQDPSSDICVYKSLKSWLFLGGPGRD